MSLSLHNGNGSIDCTKGPSPGYVKEKVPTYSSTTNEEKHYKYELNAYHHHHLDFPKIT